MLRSERSISKACKNFRSRYNSTDILFTKPDKSKGKVWALETEGFKMEQTMISAARLVETETIEKKWLLENLLPKWINPEKVDK